MSHRNAIVVFFLTLMLSISSSAIHLPSMPPQAEYLGRVRFVNSCSPKVQTEFNGAVAMLHSFQYGLAERTFSHVLGKIPNVQLRIGARP